MDQKTSKVGDLFLTDALRPETIEKIAHIFEIDPEQLNYRLTNIREVHNPNLAVEASIAFS